MCFWLFIRINKINSVHGTSLVVQWVRLCASTAGSMGSISSWGSKMQHVLSKKKKIASIRQVPPGGLVTKLCPTLATLWTVACKAPQSMAFSKQEYWSGLPFPSPGDLPHPGINSGLLHCGWILFQLSYQGSPRLFLPSPNYHLSQYISLSATEALSVLGRTTCWASPLTRNGGC